MVRITFLQILHWLRGGCDCDCGCCWPRAGAVAVAVDEHELPTRCAEDSRRRAPLGLVGVAPIAKRAEDAGRDEEGVAEDRAEAK